MNKKSKLRNFVIIEIILFIIALFFVGPHMIAGRCGDFRVIIFGYEIPSFDSLLTCAGFGPRYFLDPIIYFIIISIILWYFFFKKNKD